MNRQSNFDNGQPTLFLVPTPIGNLDEMTPRAIEVLKSADVIACEDTRNSGLLLQRFGIKNRLVAYENFNEVSSCKGLIKLLEEGKDIALISDAGYPLINDPGQRIVTEATKMGFNVVPLSGCNAMLNALVASGLIVQPFIFIGFLPAHKNDRIRKLREYEHYPMTMVFYEAPHRLSKCLEDCQEVLGNRQCCLARELTKLHEEFIRGTISEIREIADTLKGEMVLVIEGKPEEVLHLDNDYILNMVNERIAEGMSTSEAAKAVAHQTGMSKNEVYQLVHRKGN